MYRRYFRSPKRWHQDGFTLIELMIGLLLGLLTVLVITQVMANAEGRKRTVSMGGDAQTNGAMALYTIQRDVQMSGYGMTSSPDALGCEVRAQYDAAFPLTFTLAPVVINDGGVSGADSITVLRAQAPGFSLPITIAGPHPQTADHFVVTSSFGAAVRNMMIAVPKLQGPTTWCTLFQVADDTSSPNTTLASTVVPHVAGPGSLWNQVSLFPSGGYAKDDYLLNMNSLVKRTYSIFTVNNAYSLRATELSTATGVPMPQDLYPQIVNLQAFYAKGTLDPAGNVVISSYTKATPTIAEWPNVVAIRIAVVARSNQYEKDPVTLTQPQWDVGSSPAVIGTATVPCNGSSSCITMKVDQLADWDHYRYKLFETIVPLRNVLWNS